MTRQPDRSFFEVSALECAPRLLGAVFSHETAEGLVALRITEVEAYHGDGADPGSHTFRGRTKRNSVMFGEPGRVYTYFTYGMHVCANLVCSPEGAASAVLLRGGEIVDGIELARSRRGVKVPDRDLGRGPARLVVALGIELGDGGSDALTLPFSLRLAESPSPFLAGPRTGVSGPGGGGSFPWRFWIPDDPTVSPYRRHPKAL